MKMQIMKENEFGMVGKCLAAICLVAFAGFALVNIARGEVPHPVFFSVVFAGFLLFLVAKVPVVLRTQLISFGTKSMSPTMANVYRAGYWLMFVGILATFA